MKVRTQRHTNSFSILLIMLFLLILSGCTARTTSIRATGALFKKNRVSTIALFGEGKVNHPEYRQKNFSITLNTSRDSLEKTLKATTCVLEQKGYRVVTAKPIAVCHGSKGWRLNQVGVAKNDRKLISNNEPLYLYPELKEGPEATAALRRLVDDLEDAIRRDHISGFKPAPNDMKIVREHIDADVICILSFTGLKHSDGQKGADIAVSALARPASMLLVNPKAQSTWWAIRTPS